MPDPAVARHILSYAETLRGGGVERALLRLAGGWATAGRRVTLLIGDATGPLAPELPDGVAVERWTGGLAHHFRMLSPDLLFCPGNHYTGYAAVARLRLGRRAPPMVAKMSNALDRADLAPPLRLGNRAWLRLHPRFCDRLVAMTPTLAEETARLTGMPRARVAVIPNPPALPRPGAAPVALPPGRVVLGVGRLVPQKRWDRLIAALLELPADVRLVILGEGPERAGLEAQAMALGVADRVELPGHAADPLPVLAQATVAALTSEFEGVPGVLREALSVGTPVVTTDSSTAVAEIVTSPALGTIVPREDAGALAAALNSWLSPDAARPAPVPPPGADAVARYLALFDEVVAERRG